MWTTEENSDSEVEDEVEDVEKSFKPTFVVIAIDTHPIMFRKKEDDSTPFRDALSACYSLADSLLLASSSRSWNQFAVLLAREESPCLTDFRDKMVDVVKLLKEKINSPNKQLAEEFQRKGDFDLASFFLSCKKVFHDLKNPFYRRILIYITDDDEPVLDAAKKFTAFNEAKTFTGSQIDFQVIPTRTDFDDGKFYNELMSLLDNSFIEKTCEHEEDLAEKLASTVTTRRRRTKMLFYPFKNDTSRFLNCYKLDFIQSSSLNPIKLRRDGKAVKSVTGGDVVYYFKDSQCDIEFDSFEKGSLIDNSFPKGLTLLYVSPRVTDAGYILSKPFLLQPQNKDDTYFKKFWQCCSDKERVLVGAFKYKELGMIRYVELIPVFVNNSSMFLVKYIPYNTEIFPPAKSNYPEHETDKGKKEAIQKLVETLTFDFDVKMTPDPTYLKRKEYVKSKLLDEPMQEVSDITLQTKELDECLKEPLNLINKNFVFAEEKKKRKATTSASRAKKAK